MDIHLSKRVLVAIGVVLLVAFSAVVGVVTNGIVADRRSTTTLRPAALAEPTAAPTTPPTPANAPAATTAQAAPSSSAPAPVKTVTVAPPTVAVPVPVAVPQPVRTKYVPYGPPAVGGWHEVITASGDDVLIRSGPSTGYSKLAAVPTGTLVQTSCYVFGETINGNSIWDRVSSPYVGYIADAFVADTASVPAC